jgi:hypothetical protein
VTPGTDVAHGVAARPDAGSFRDPFSRVFIDDDAIWRGLSAEALADFDALAASTFFTAAVERGDIVATERVADVAPVPGEWAAVLRHARIDVLSYPYEWSFEMLRDAARLQLALTRQALAESLITKDASAYNVQFVGSKPVFIDVGSFERLRPGEPWAGYRQFCELYLNPLYVQALRDVPFQPLLRGRLDGIPPGVAAAIIGSAGHFRKGVFTHVRLHARAERKYADADRERDVRAELKRAGFGSALIDAQLRNLERAVDRLSWKQQDSTWSGYGDRGHYTDGDLDAKSTFVANAVAADGPPKVVLDLGANDGHFSRIAVDSGAASAIAVDSDHLVVDRLYRQLRERGEQRILPLVVDLADPSPAIGWRTGERMSFAQRMRPDLVLCLAVVHHLALTNNVPLDEIGAFLADFGAPVVVEFPHRDDVMTTRLLARKRPGLFDAYHVGNWERALEQRFVIDDRQALPSGTRTIYRCRPR